MVEGMTPYKSEQQALLRRADGAHTNPLGLEK
jgi:hypothetical protein